MALERLRLTDLQELLAVQHKLKSEVDISWQLRKRIALLVDQTAALASPDLCCARESAARECSTLKPGTDMPACVPIMAPP